MKRLLRLFSGVMFLRTTANLLKLLLKMRYSVAYFSFCSKANLLEADVWKEFLARPSLPYVLRLLSGLCKGHKSTQVEYTSYIVNYYNKFWACYLLCSTKHA